MSRPTRGYRFLDHTADLGVEAWAPTLDAAFEEAARGVFAYVLEPTRVDAVGEVQVEVTGRDAEELLLNWLDELLFVQQTELVAFEGYHVDELENRPGDDDDAWHLTARVTGEDYDASKHGHIHEVKAVTYHGLLVERDPPRVEVILDI